MGDLPDHILLLGVKCFRDGTPEANYCGERDGFYFHIALYRGKIFLVRLADAEKWLRVGEYQSLDEAIAGLDRLAFEALLEIKDRAKRLMAMIPESLLAEEA